ncbi:hypothetical protein [Cellulomonas endophytica]|uniref:hypothetical protein n=1 Tax=Cellulomonas endophytica TaxID=2494735 RepID=UPI00101240AC|nr:hypothetical protein [Cellulomonas endophytica]
MTHPSAAGPDDDDLDHDVDGPDRTAVLPDDAVTRALDELAAKLARDLRGVADVETDAVRGTASCDVLPHRAGALGVWWVHDAESLEVGVGEAGGWEVGRDAAGLARATHVVWAAVHGRVRVCLTPRRTRYAVDLPDGSTLVDERRRPAAALLRGPWRVPAHDAPAYR